MANHSKKPRNRTAAGSPIITDLGFVDPSSGSTSVKTVRKAAVRGKNGITYLIPIDGKGKVPKYAIYGRLADINSGTRDGHRRSVGADVSKVAEKVHKTPKKGWTPEEIVNCGWWMYPGESDIEGIDDRPLPGAKDILGMPAGGRMIILASDEDSRRIAETLDGNFTDSEIRKAVKDSGIVIMTDNPGRNNSGYYVGKQPGVSTPRIVLEPLADEDTITHEFIHHLRRVDGDRDGVARCPYPVTDEGMLEPDLLTRTDYGSMTNWEEAATVTEATARTKEKSTPPCGYYSYIPSVGREGRDAAYDHDRELMTRGGKGHRPARGKNAIRRVNQRFDDTKISELKYKKGRSAKSAIAEAKASGTFYRKASQVKNAGRRR